MNQLRLVTEIETTEERRCIWIVFACLGYLQAVRRYPDLFKRGLYNQAVLREQVAEVLGQKFELSQGEQLWCLEMFEEEHLDR